MSATDATEEIERWLESFGRFRDERGKGSTTTLLESLLSAGKGVGAVPREVFSTPYLNTIAVEDEPAYPGDLDLEKRIRSIIRWNAMAMVVQANRRFPGLGGHISTYASAATLLEVGFHHFFRGREAAGGGDHVFFQGHASPGIYARGYLEGRFEAKALHAFRRELAGGLSSYPHPWLMPDYWEFPTVSMGLGPIQAIYQARFDRYLQARGIRDTSDQNVWAFLGDGEMDEPESLGAITLASREELDNLIFVVNCNLQRLDGPVRGNGKIVQELEAAFRGAGWNVIKVLWGDDWDPLLARDENGLLARRMEDAVDGDYQKYTVESGAYIREHFFGTHPRLLEMVRHLTDAKLRKLRRGGHDAEKVYAAYDAAVRHRGAPTVILAKTVKGWGLGEAGEGRNVTHQQKKLNESELRTFRDRVGIPIRDEDLADAPFYRPADDSDEVRYALERREALGGFLPRRITRPASVAAPKADVFDEFLKGTDGRPVATTMVAVRVLRQLLQDPELGPRIVPIVPDEARTFGMDSLFRKYGIYSVRGQQYEPADSDVVAYYRESVEGQILEEGITEAGAMCSFTAAGTSYSRHGQPMIPFYFFYSMFGFQRVGDLIWQNADSRGRGFLFGATAGRTTLAGEGLQHQDGHSLLLASTVPTVRAWDPAFPWEVAIVVRDGLRRMLDEDEDLVDYLTVGNEMLPMPDMPEGVEGDLLKGLYRFREGPGPREWPSVRLIGSGSILHEVLGAADLLDRYEVRADVWSAPSFGEVRREALDVDRWNRLHPASTPRVPWVRRKLGDDVETPIVVATDFMKAVPHQVAPWIDAPFVVLGTDGFGRSDTRAALRRFFEVDSESIAIAALSALARQGKIPAGRVETAFSDLGVDPEAPNPSRR